MADASLRVPQRVRLSRAKGFRLGPDAVNCARPGRWGNPFVVGVHGTRAQCVSSFVNLALGFISLSASVEVTAQRMMHRRIARRAVADLGGRDLACWCSLDGPCHADVLLVLANERPLTDLNPLTVEPTRPSIGMMAATLDTLERKRRAKERVLSGTLA